MWLPLPRLPQKVSIGQGMGPNLLVRLMGVMHPTQPSTTWYGICRHATMWLWNKVIPNTHLFGRHEGSRSCGHECMGLEQPLGSLPSQWTKAIAQTKRCAFLEWDRLQSDLKYTPKVPKPTLVKLASGHILWLLSVTARGVGAIPFNLQPKLEHDEDLALVIQITQTGYEEVFKSTWMERDWKMHQIKRFNIRRFASLHNTLIQKWFMVGKFLTIKF
jgi:hypothetical protein